jgi:hypothetical protein
MDLTLTESLKSHVRVGKCHYSDKNFMGAVVMPYLKID